MENVDTMYLANESEASEMKRWIYRMLKFSNDVNAVRRGRVGRRVARRAYGKATGRLARKLFR